MLLFSVIIPLFNRENFIQKAIKSVLDQSISAFELIIVDDASTDGSIEKVSEIKDPRIKLISLPENRGNAKARNEGWKAAKAEWVVFLDSDDWFEYNYLECLSDAINLNKDCSFFWTGVRYINLSGVVIKKEFWNPQDKLPSSTFFDELRIGTNCGVAFSKDLLITFQGFNESFKASVDREFFLRISQEVKGQGIKSILVNCLIGDHDSVRKEYINQSNAYNKLIELHRTQIDSSILRQKWWYHKAMWLSLYCGNIHEAKIYLKALDYHPKSLFLFTLFLLFPINIAKKVHKKLAS